VKSDIDIYNELAQILIAYAPVSAGMIILKFVIKVEQTVEESGMYRFYFDYINQNGVENWFDIDEVGVPSKIADLCLELREMMEQGAQSGWTILSFEIDVGKGKFSADFKYGEL